MSHEQPVIHSYYGKFWWFYTVLYYLFKAMQFFDSKMFKWQP